MKALSNENDGWDNLNEVYKEKGLVLVLGAGVSKDSRIPIWNGLLLKTAATINTLKDPYLLECLIKRGFTLQVIASLLEEHCPTRKQRSTFIRILRESLYDDFLKYHGLTRPIDFSKRATQKQFIDTVRRARGGNTTLRTIGAMCAIRNAQTVRPNPNIHAIVTLNIDWLLQAFVRAHFNLDAKRTLVRTIDRPSATASEFKIPLYHMHGLLRFDEKQDDSAKEAADRVVITEQDYFDFFNDPTSVLNYTFLHLLREHSCLFVGLSMNDENIRRLLHYSKRERIRSLEDEQKALKRKRRKNANDIREKVTRHYAILPHANPAVDSAVENTLAPLGTRVLWINDFDDIRTRFEALYDRKHGRGRWATVYRGASSD